MQSNETAGPARGVSQDTGVVLDEHAEAVLGVLAATGGADLPLAVIAALADIPTVAAGRHLRHLGRLGAVRQPRPERFRLGENGVERWGITPVPVDALARQRVSAWYAASVFAGATALGWSELPGGGVVLSDPSRPPMGFSGPGQALEWFTATWPDLIDVLTVAVEDGDVGNAWHLSALMLNLACLVGGTGWQEVVDLAARAARLADDARPMALVLEFQGKLHLTNGQLAAAQAAHDESLRVRTEAGDTRGVTRANNAEGLVALRARDYPLALTYFERTLALAQENGDEEFTVFGRMNRGAVLARLGQAGQAIVELGLAAEVLRARGQRAYLSNALQDLAHAYRIDGQHERGLQIALEALEAAVESEIPMFLPGVLIELAAHRTRAGETRLALAHLQEARAIYEQLGDALNTGRVQEQIDELAQHAGSPRDPAGAVTPSDR